MVAISTILLIMNFVFLLIKDKALFSFWHFVWLYPVEFLLYLGLGFLWIKVVEWWVK